MSKEKKQRVPAGQTDYFVGGPHAKKKLLNTGEIRAIFSKLSEKYPRLFNPPTRGI